MTNSSPFPGFPPEALQFLTGLVENNNRDWFEAHKQDYKTYIVAPSQAFVQALGEGLQTISPHIQYDTRTNGSGSMMRIYRDIRFSKDKTPYKDYIGYVFWQGSGKKTENPAFYMGLTGQGIGLHVGMHGFPKPLLTAYREAVVDEALGEELETAVAAVKNAGPYTVDGQHYKRVPRGYDKDHPRADFLRYNALYASSPPIPPDIVTSPELITACLNHCHNMAPVQQWLAKINPNNV